MLTIAAAGHHHALLVSPPGTGKTLLAKSVLELDAFPNPPGNINNKIYSCAGLLPPNSGLISQRPIRMPHHNITSWSAGRWIKIQPGEVTLASHRV